MICSRGPAPFLSFAAGKSWNLLRLMPRLFTDFDLLLPDHSIISRCIMRLTDPIHLFCRPVAFSRTSSPHSAIWCNYYSNHRILIKLCAFVGSNCRNWIITLGMDKVKCHLVLARCIYSILSFPKGYPVAVHVFFLVFPPLYPSLYLSFNNVL